MGARLADNQNAAIFDDFWQSRTPTYYTYFKREFDKKGVNIGVLAGGVLLLSGIEAEFSLADQNRSEEFKYVPHVYLNGDEIDCQTIKERSTLNLDWRKRIAFVGKLKPLGITRFSVRVEKTPVAKRSVRGRGISRRLIDYRFKILKQPELNSQELGSDFSFST